MVNEKMKRFYWENIVLRTYPFLIIISQKKKVFTESCFKYVQKLNFFIWNEKKKFPTKVCSNTLLIQVFVSFSCVISTVIIMNATSQLKEYVSHRKLAHLSVTQKNMKLTFFASNKWDSLSRIPTQNNKNNFS